MALTGMIKREEVQKNLQEEYLKIAYISPAPIHTIHILLMERPSHHPLPQPKLTGQLPVFPTW